MTEAEEVYERAAEAIKAVEKMEQIAADDPVVTVTMPIKAAIEAMCAISLKLSIDEDSLQSRFRDNHLPDLYARAEIAKLRIAIDAFRDGLKALDSPPAAPPPAEGGKHAL